MGIAVRRQAVLVAAWAGLCTPVWGMVAGTPEPPRPGPLPGLWFGLTNDSFGGSIGKDMDDYRTNAFSGGWRWRRFIVAADYSMLTDYRTSGASKQRTDELNGSLGYEIVPDGTTLLGGDSWLAAGAGVRHHGDLGGESIQNHWHDLMDYRRVSLPYAPDEGTEGLGYVAGRWMWTNPVGWDMPVLGFISENRVGIEFDGACLGTTDGAIDARLGVSLVVVDAGASIGIHQEWHAGHRSTAPERAVAGNESGTWVTVTSSAGGWYFTGGYNLDDRSGLGTIGWMWNRPPGREGAASVGVMEGIVGFYQGYAYGFQYRWHADWLDGISNDRLAFIVDYRCGQHPQQDWKDNAIVVRQPLLGIDWSLADSSDGFECVPFLYAGVGIREERVVTNGAHPRYPYQKATTGVAQGGAGLRLFFGDRPSPSDPARYGLSLVYDWWLPFHAAEATNAAGGDPDKYQLPGSGFGFRLAASVLW